jgi:hypothetical protein
MPLELILPVWWWRIAVPDQSGGMDATDAGAMVEGGSENSAQSNKCDQDPSLPSNDSFHLFTPCLLSATLPRLSAVGKGRMAGIGEDLSPFVDTRPKDEPPPVATLAGERSNARCTPSEDYPLLPSTQPDDYRQHATKASTSQVLIDLECR